MELEYYDGDLGAYLPVSARRQRIGVEERGAGWAVEHSAKSFAVPALESTLTLAAGMLTQPASQVSGGDSSSRGVAGPEFAPIVAPLFAVVEPRFLLHMFQESFSRESLLLHGPSAW